MPELDPVMLDDIFGSIDDFVAVLDGLIQCHHLNIGWLNDRHGRLDRWGFGSLTWEDHPADHHGYRGEPAAHVSQDRVQRIPARVGR